MILRHCRSSYRTVEDAREHGRAREQDDDMPKAKRQVVLKNMRRN